MVYPTEHLQPHKQLHNIQQQNNNQTQPYFELFHQTTNHARHETHKTDRSIDRATQHIQGYKITLTTTQIQEAIKQSMLKIRHIKHIGPLGLAFLTSMFITTLNNNIIPHIWKLASIVPIPKPTKDIGMDTPYPLSNYKDTGEEPSSLYYSKHTKHTHVTWVQNTTLYSDGITHTNTVAKGFNQMASPV